MAEKDTDQRTEKEAPRKEKGRASTEDVIMTLWSQVFRKSITMAEAEKKLLDYVNSLSESEKDDLKQKARLWGQYMVMVSEGFQQVLTVIGAS